MNPYPNDPRYGQPQPVSPLHSAKRRMQGWWGAFGVTFVLGIILSAAYSSTLVAHTNPYINTPQPTSLTYVFLIVGLVNGVVGTVAFIIAIRATRECSQIKRSMFGGYR